VGTLPLDVAGLVSALHRNLRRIFRPKARPLCRRWDV
jgi:hypothetical protein